MGPAMTDRHSSSGQQKTSAMPTPSIGIATSDWYIQNAPTTMRKRAARRRKGGQGGR